MDSLGLPASIQAFFNSKGEGHIEQTLACFTQDATVWDNGEDRELRGAAAISEWLTETAAAYSLKSEVVSAEHQGEEIVTGVIVSGSFPGSPYKFENRFRLADGQITELTINPIGPAGE